MSKNKKDQQMIDYDKARVASGYGPHNLLELEMQKLNDKEDTENL